MIIRTVYNIEVDHGKDPSDTPYAVNGLNLCQYPVGVVYVFDQDPCSDGPVRFVIWKLVNSLGDHSLFLGINYLITVNLNISNLEAPDGTLVPFIRKNCVYTLEQLFCSSVKPRIMRFHLQANEGEPIGAISLPRDGWNSVRRVSIWFKPSVYGVHSLRSLGA
jgi:hypothetical protein